VSDRLSAADAAFFYLDGPTTPQHVGGIAILSAPDGFDYDRLVRLIEERISLAPRYRQKIRAVPGNLANPVWVDDADFDISYHVRRSALPRPGTERELLEFAARIQARLLDRDRPLWEMYLVEGMTDGRVAIVTKTHPCMVEGRRNSATGSGIDITEVLLDDSPEPRRTVSTLWMPEHEPSVLGLMTGALCDTLRRPAAVLDPVRLSVREARMTTARVTATAGTLGMAAVSALTRSRRTPRQFPLRATLGMQRRIAVARVPLDQLRAVRDRRGSTVHDVILAVVAGALRDWLLERGEALEPAATVCALVPIGHDGDAAPARGWNQAGGIAAVLIDLPVGDPDPVRRLTRVQYAMAAHAATGGAVAADTLAGLSGFAPPTLHSLSARAAHGLTRRMYDVSVTNVPGPQRPRYAAGAQLAEIYPVMPLAEGHAVSVGITSYNGAVYFGITADRDAVPDVDRIAASIDVSLRELTAASQPVDIAGGRRTGRQEPRK
jgi:diacylglycerol O-acyltransferase / wax synthase